MWLLDSLTDKKMNIHLKLDDSDIILYIKVIDNDKQISRMDIIKHNDENCLYIGDILRFSKNKYYNKGIGTMMMNELIAYVHKRTEMPERRFLPVFPETRRALI